MNEEKASSRYRWIGLGIGLSIGTIAYFFGVLETVKFIMALIILRVIIKKPTYGMILYILSIPFVSDVNTLLIGIVVIASYCIDFIRTDSFKFKFTPANFFIFLFAIIIAINTFLSITPKGSLRDFAIHLVSIGIVFVLIHSKKSKKEIYLLSVVFTLTAVIVSIYGFYQFFHGVPMGSGWIDVSQNPDIKIRVFATFENPNLLAEYLIMVLPISIGLILYSKNKFTKICFSIGALIIFVCDLLTYSRGSWIGFAFSIIVFILLTDFKKLALFIPVGIGSLFLMPDSVLNRISTIGSLQDSSNFYRFNVWNMAIDILKDYWFSGIGVGYIAFRKISPFYIKTMSPYHTHNTYLQIAIELGIVGVIVFLLLVLFIFKMGINSIINGEDKFIKISTASYIASLCAILVHGMAEHVFFNPKIILVFWLIVGMNLSIYRVYKEV
ncbi:O-antigen ligase family protein [Paramaledivibacter caminithermalis]|jgi:O-antigen ligase|uniref:O-antigen ligase n=1 Tax=Paramaledivibacter caminithermalis (strain DSM 15212 / CIP 107654 / DViRD3) TaxID=1121301 RepID=A0A1M6KSN5_PARC5|nr:O-antigen ligase family protein [Paramaledivibacter caminithermalis]SHJ61890.1 O-antigen ligase [Paramaledivibacter caminithermalis DSM 15212]